ncbi:MAG: prolipoprotein diacylglyceryl transferase [Halocynthiibacter sp.]
MNALIPFPNISPEIFEIDIFGFGFALRWYALAYIAGILIGWRIAVRAVRNVSLWPKGNAPMTAIQVEELLTWIVVGIVVGGRLGFVLFYQPAYYFANPADILKVWQGGMSFHGGLLGVTIAGLIYCRKNAVPIVGTADMLALATPTGLFLGRVANFTNAELWGRPTDVPWAVAFPGAAAQNCGQLATELCGRHPSQLYEAALEGLLLGGVLIYFAWKRGWLKKPGQITGLFAAGYGTARVFVEFYRQADAQFITPDNPMGYVLQIGSAGVSMGQILSLPLVVIGVAIILLARRRV